MLKQLTTVLVFLTISLSCTVTKYEEETYITYAQAIFDAKGSLSQKTASYIIARKEYVALTGSFSANPRDTPCPLPTIVHGEDAQPIFNELGSLYLTQQDSQPS